MVLSVDGGPAAGGERTARAGLVGASGGRFGGHALSGATDPPMAIFPNGLDRIFGQLSGGGTFHRPRGAPESAGARKNGAGSARAVVAIAATAFGVSGISGVPEFARADFSRRPDQRTIWTERRGLPRAGGHDGFDPALRRFAESQIGKAMPQRESARVAGSDSTGSARAESARLAAVFACVHGGGGGEAAERSGHRRRLDRLGALGLRSLCAHEEILRAHGEPVACRMCRTRFSGRRS